MPGVLIRDKRADTQTQRSCMETEAGTGGTWLQSTLPGAPGSWQRQEGASREPVKGAQPCPTWTSEPPCILEPHVDLQCLISRAGDDFCSFKVPGLWEFVSTTQGTSTNGFPVYLKRIWTLTATTLHFKRCKQLITHREHCYLNRQLLGDCFEGIQGTLIGLIDATSTQWTHEGTPLKYWRISHGCCLSLTLHFISTISTDLMVHHMHLCWDVFLVSTPTKAQ